MTTSNQGAQFIINHEGKRNDWYQDVIGLWTIGVGHMNNSKSLPDGLRAPLSDADIMKLLKLDLQYFEGQVSKVIKVPLSQNQFDALVSFAFNLGQVNEDLRNAVNNGLTGAKLKAVFQEYVNAGGKVQPFLQEIREAEYELFTFGKYGHTFGTGYSGDTSGKEVAEGTKGVETSVDASSNPGSWSFMTGPIEIPPAITTIVSDDPKTQQIINMHRKNLHMDNLEDLLSMGYPQINAANGDPEYGEYPSYDTGVGSNYGVDPMVNTGYIGLPGFYPVPRSQKNVDRGAYQKKLGEYYHNQSNYSTLKPMDSSKFYMTNGERSNHFQQEMIYYMNVLYSRVINNITDKQGKMLMICSGFRSLELNSQTDGAASYSAHSGGIACDIYLPSSLKDRLYVLDTAYSIGFGGLGLYDTFVHVDLSGRAFWGGYNGPRGT